MGLSYPLTTWLSATATKFLILYLLAPVPDKAIFLYHNYLENDNIFIFVLNKDVIVNVINMFYLVTSQKTSDRFSEVSIRTRTQTIGNEIQPEYYPDNRYKVILPLSFRLCQMTRSE